MIREIGVSEAGRNARRMNSKCSFAYHDDARYYGCDEMHNQDSSSLYYATPLSIHRLSMLKKFLMTALGASLMTFVSGQAVQAANFTVLASGLDSPRGLSFGPDGALYVTEAGKGGNGACIPSPSLPGANLCYGATGAVTRIQNGKSERVVTGLPSLALSNGSDTAGINDIAFDSTGKAYAIIGLAGNPANRDNILGIPDFGNLIAINDFNGGASWTRVADLAAYEGQYNPDGTDVISNIYNFLIQGDTARVVDSGANDLLSVGLDGSGLALQSVFPGRSVANPLSDQDIFMQSVPTSIAKGLDGAYYIGELTGVPFPQGGARIYRLNPSNNQPEIYAEGFTSIVDLAFAPDQSLYVLEYANDTLFSGNGALIRITPDGTRTTIASEQLITPTALTLGSDGAIYVSNKGFNAGVGEILRIETNQLASVAEPSAALGILVFGALGTLLTLKRNQTNISRTKSA